MRLIRSSSSPKRKTSSQDVLKSDRPSFSGSRRSWRGKKGSSLIKASSTEMTSRRGMAAALARAGKEGWLHLEMLYGLHVQDFECLGGRGGGKGGREEREGRSSGGGRQKLWRG
jgi:hypothetical protein